MNEPKTLEDLRAIAEEIRTQYETYNREDGKETWRIRDYAMGFVGDVGDLQKIIMAKENLRNVQDVDAKLAHELADCLWSILVIANYYNIDLGIALEDMMQKIAHKIKDKSA